MIGRHSNAAMVAAMMMGGLGASLLPGQAKEFRTREEREAADLKEQARRAAEGAINRTPATMKEALENAITLLRTKRDGEGLQINGPDGQPVAMVRRNRKVPSGYEVKPVGQHELADMIGALSGIDSKPGSRAARRRAVRKVGGFKDRFRFDTPADLPPGHTVTEATVHAIVTGDIPDGPIVNERTEP